MEGRILRLVEGGRIELDEWRIFILMERRVAQWIGRLEEHAKETRAG